MAAHEIASYLAKRQGWKDMTIYERAVNRAKALSKTTTEVHRRMKGPANFFKHADLDPDGEIEFDEGMNEALLGMAVGCLLVLTHSLTAIENAYMVRLALEQPDRFSLPRSNTLSPEERAMLRDMSRQDSWADQKKQMLFSGIKRDSTLIVERPRARLAPLAVSHREACPAGRQATRLLGRRTSYSA
jgi:hypothetical protein